MEAAACAKPATGYTYTRRQPEKTALFQVVQQHLLTFEQQWTDQSDGRTLPSFVTDELHDFLGCGILARGLAQLLCPTCYERYVVAWSCKGRAFCPSCGGRRMNAGALTLVDHVLPEVPIRQFVLTVPFPLRFPLRVLFASSLSSRPRTPSRRSWPAWVCPPRHLNPIRQDLLRLNRLNRGTAQST